MIVKATPDAMLRAVHGFGFVEERGEMQDRHCRYCGVWLDKCGAHDPEPHNDDCLYLQIEEHLKEIGQI